MGNSLAVDWPSLRAAAVALRNVRAAARQAAAHLPKEEALRFTETVAKRAQREGWLAKADAAVLSLSKEDKITSGRMSFPVLSGADALANLEPDSRLKLAVAGNNAVTHLAKLKPAKAAARTQPMLNAAKVLSVAHSWSNEKGQSGPLLNLNFYSSPDALKQIHELPDAARLCGGSDEGNKTGQDLSSTDAPTE